MKAEGIVFSEMGKVAVWEIELPEPGPRDVVTKTLYSGVSIGTEGWVLMNKYKGVTYPLVTGYQNCGRVEKVGDEVKDLKEGDLVFLRYTRLAGDIRPMWAGHTSYAVAERERVIKVPEGVPPEEASLLVMPAVPWHGIQLTGIEPGDLVVVIGQGLIGQTAAQLCRLKGASKVIATEVHEKRLQLSAQYSADIALDPEKEDVEAYIKKEKGSGADVIFDTSANSEAVNQSFNWIRRRGRYCFQGYYPDLTPLDLFLPHVKELVFYFPTDCEGLETMLEFLRDGKLKISPLITHRFHYKEASKAYELMLKEPGEAVAIVIDWTG